jgi:nucleotide-binding universal stress UspA family protein
MYRSIVIGFDGTEHSRDAVALGVALAQATGASLTFVHAFYDVPDPLPDPLRGKLRKQAEHTLRELGLEIPGDVVAAKHLVSQRSPARALFEHAEEKEADLIVLGSSRGAAAGRMTSGRLARQVVDGAPCAVVIAAAGLHGREDPRPQCIGVGVDGGAESAHALVAAGELARAFGARLRVMAAVETVEPVLSHYGLEAEELARQELEANAAHALQRAVEAAPSDVAVDPVRLAGETAAQALTEDATAAGVDLLVVGARGFGPIRRVLLGSVSAELMRGLPCGLMVVPRGAREPSRAAVSVGHAVKAG